MYDTEVIRIESYFKPIISRDWSELDINFLINLTDQNPW